MNAETLEGSWIVRAYRDGEEMVVPDPDGPEPVLHIAGGEISGTLGVNRFTGLLDGGLVRSPLATTRMAGTPRLMEQEETLLGLLAETEEIDVDGDGMTMSRGGLNLVELQRSETGDKPGIV